MRSKIELTKVLPMRSQEKSVMSVYREAGSPLQQILIAWALVAGIALLVTAASIVITLT
jgi:hypothetical protein